MRLIVGLGNQGKNYQKNRHNLGFMAINRLTKEDLKDIILFKPDSFMNNSGTAVAQKTNYLKIKPQDILVICDDYNLPLGEIRYRENGSSGGHNGLQSIIDVLKTEDFPRIRVGIGQVPQNLPAEKFVLTDFKPDEEEAIKNALDQVAETIVKLKSQNDI